MGIFKLMLYKIRVGQRAANALRISDHTENGGNGTQSSDCVMDSNDYCSGPIIHDTKFTVVVFGGNFPTKSFVYLFDIARAIEFETSDFPHCLL